MSNEVIKQNEILFVDNSPTVLAMAKKMLSETYVIHTTRNDIEAYETIVNNQNISMAFIDLHMPENNGMHLLAKIKGHEDTRVSKMSIIMATGKSDTVEARHKASDIGVTDFINKPLDTLDLTTCVRKHIGKGHKRGGGAPKEQEKNRDTLTSPGNFHSTGTQSLNNASEKNGEFSVVYIQIVNYKDLKDSIGDISVKHVIATLAARIGNIIQEKDVATRIGEDKYAILLHTGNKYAEIAVKKLYNHLANVEFIFSDKKINAELKYGYSSADIKNKSLTFAELCNQASLSLDGADAVKNSKPVLQYISDKLSMGKQKPGDIKTISAVDLLAALKHVADGDYELIPKKHKDDVIKCVEAYLKYVETD